MDEKIHLFANFVFRVVQKYGNKVTFLGIRRGRSAQLPPPGSGPGEGNLLLTPTLFLVSVVEMLSQNLEKQLFDQTTFGKINANGVKNTFLNLRFQF